MLTKQRDHVATGASEPLRAGETGQQCSSAKFRGHLRQLGEPAVGQKQGQLELDESLSTCCLSTHTIHCPDAATPPLPRLDDGERRKAPRKAGWKCAPRGTPGEAGDGDDDPRRGLAERSTRR